MTSNMTRRGVIAGAATIAAPFVISKAAGPAFAQPTDPRMATLMPGVTIILDAYIRHHKLDVENGVNLMAASEYTSVQTYYNDFDVGAYDLCYGSWDTFAVRYLAGVPCKLLCTLSVGNGISFAGRKGEGISSIDDLPDRVIAAPQSSGTYRVTRAVIKESKGWDLQESARVQNVTNATAAMSLLRSGVTEAALGWEPNVSDGLHQDDNLTLIGSIGDEYRKLTGQPLPYMSIGIRDELLEKNPEIGGRLSEMFRMCIEGIVADPEGTAELLGDRAGFSPEVLVDVIRSGKLGFEYGSMGDEDARGVVKTAADFFLRNELLPSELQDSFMVQS